MDITRLKKTNQLKKDIVDPVIKSQVKKKEKKINLHFVCYKSRKCIR
jgi:hypothetical protein